MLSCALHASSNALRYDYITQHLPEAASVSQRCKNVNLLGDVCVKLCGRYESARQTDVLSNTILHSLLTVIFAMKASFEMHRKPSLRF